MKVLCLLFSCSFPKILTTNVTFFSLSIGLLFPESHKFESIEYISFPNQVLSFSNVILVPPCYLRNRHIISSTSLFSIVLFGYTAGLLTSSLLNDLCLLPHICFCETSYRYLLWSLWICVPAPLGKANIGNYYASLGENKTTLKVTLHFFTDFIFYQKKRFPFPNIFTDFCFCQQLFLL